jgi:hypothetical protein
MSTLTSSQSTKPTTEAVGTRDDEIRLKWSAHQRWNWTGMPNSTANYCHHCDQNSQNHHIVVDRKRVLQSSDLNKEEYSSHN